MKLQKMASDSLHWYINELTSRIVAESGTPSDIYHLGKMIFQSLKDDPDLVSQIDGSTNESETASSVLQRTVRCAASFQTMGLVKGDVIVLMAPSHLNLTIPLYAALYLGIIVAVGDSTLGIEELEHKFKISKPKIIFCQSNRASDIQAALNNLNLDSQIVTFDKGDYLCSFDEFMEKGDVIEIDDFKPADIDPENAVAFLVATSGTTGMPKAAVLTHKNLAIAAPTLWIRSVQFPRPTQLAMIVSPLQWLTAILHFILSPILRYSRLQTSEMMTPQHGYHLINTYKPTYTIISPTLLTTLIKPGDRNQCDFSSLTVLMISGSAVPQDLIDNFKTLSPDTDVYNAYGMSELSGLSFQCDNSALGSCGKPLGSSQYRIINVNTLEDINEANVPGEMWLKGPGIFKNYYNNERATEETFAEDRWFKTGDMFYRDENWNFFFVDRIKLLLKYKSYQISPVEVEAVIRHHPGVMDVAVTGIPDPECGELAVACVVPNPGYKPTAEEIKDLVREKLSDSKQLRGEVIFVKAIPQTASTKVHRRKINEMAMVLPRE